MKMGVSPLIQQPQSSRVSSVTLCVTVRHGWEHWKFSVSLRGQRTSDHYVLEKRERGL